MRPNVINAVRALVPNAQFVASETGIMQWHSSETQPSQEDVDAKLKELQDDYDAKKYQRDRADSYPEIGDQLDMLFHAIDAGALDKNSDFYTTLKAVKDKYPKG